MKKKFKTVLRLSVRLILLVGLLFPSSLEAAKKGHAFPAEKLSGRIKRISERYSVNISFDDKLLKDVSVPALVWEGKNLEETLESSLGNSSFTYRKISTGSYVIVRREQSRGNPSPRGEIHRAGRSSVRGRVVESETSDPLPGATVTIAGTDLSVITDSAGYYRFNRLAEGRYTLEVEYLGFKTEHVSVRLSEGHTSTADIQLTGDNNVLNEVVVQGVQRIRGSVPHTTDKMVVQEIKASPIVVSGISSEQIGKSADRNAADVVRRISGVTIRDDKFVVVRGMNERYNLTYLNGNIAPSTELYSRAFALDLLPTRIIDKIMISKSATPEDMADATGGVVRIYTKDAKMVRHFDLELQGGYREGTTFNDNYLTYTGGKYDFLGFDDGTRKLPSVVPGYGDFRKATITQKQYADNFSNILTYGKLKALPLMQFTTNFYDTWRIFHKPLSMLTSFSYKNESKHNDIDRTQGNLSYWYTIQNGIFHTGDFAQTNLSKMSSESSNTEAVQLSLLQNFSLYLNDRHKLYFKNFLLQQGETQTIVKTTATNQIYENGEWTDVYPSFPGKRLRDIVLSYSQRFLYSGNLGGEWTLDRAEKHHLNYNIGYTYSRLEIPDQRVIHLQNSVIRYDDRIAEPGWRDAYDQNWVAVWRGEDILNPDNKAELGMISRTWTRNSEGLYDASLDYSWKVQPWVALKAGTYQSFKQRIVFRRVYTVNEGDLDDSGVTNYNYIGSGQYLDNTIVFFRQQDLGKVWSEDYLRDDGSGLKVIDRTSPSDAYKGSEQNNSGYLAFSLTPFKGKLDIYGGLRVEYNRQKIASAVDGQGVGSPNIPVFVDLKGTDYLPSVNVSYRPRDLFTFRMAYGQTVNRPELREISLFNELDYQNNQVVQGNPNLVEAKIKNYDLRMEFYPKNDEKGESFSLGCFYKDLLHPIERIIQNDLYYSTAANISFQNADKAKIYGLEADLRKSLDFIPVSVFRNFYVIANGSLFYSQVKKTVGATGSYESRYNISRQLQGQSPYVYNAGLYYENSAVGSKLSLIYNEVGPRIYAASLGMPAGYYVRSDGSGYYDMGQQGSLIELKRQQLDFSFTQRISKGMQLKFSVQNLLNSPIQMAEDANFTYKYEKAQRVPNPGSGGWIGDGFKGDLLASNYKPGRYYILNFSYSF